VEIQKNDIKIQNLKMEAGTAHVHTHVDEAGHIYMHEHEYQAGAIKNGYEHEHLVKGSYGGSDKERSLEEVEAVPAAETAGADKGHRHVHTQAEKKAVLNRMAKAIGHMEAVKRMVERDEDCGAVLIQLAAVRSAINNTGKVVLKNHINHCIMEAVEENDQEAIALLDQAIDKFM
jgi:DNA-binding FrmR family transcriptional regulator